MADIRISDMMEMIEELQAHYFDQWGGLSVETGRSQTLWMIEELGESIQIIKKKGEEKIMHDPTVRSAYVEELADVMMYLTGVMLSFGITPEEFSEAFLKKHAKNMHRDYAGENRHFLETPNA